VKRDQFIRELSRDARRLGLALEVDMARGKGWPLRRAPRQTLQRRPLSEITPIMAKVIRKQLGLD